MLLTFVNVATAQFSTAVYGTKDYISYIPFNSTRNYNYTQLNYKMSELLAITGAENDFVISAISFEAESNFTSMTRELEIYFVNNYNNWQVTDSTDFLSEDDIIDDGRLVFRGSYTFTPGLNKIILDTAFLVSSYADALTIIINDITGDKAYGGYGNTYIGFYETSLSEERTIRTYNDNQPFDISCVPCGMNFYTNSSVNYLQFDYATDIAWSPMNVYYNNSYSQQLYTPQEVGGAKQIESISFYAMNGIEDYRNCTIYLGETDKSEFSDDNDWIDVSNLTQVFDGEVYIDQGWFTIHFNTPFDFHGEQNLVVAVEDHSGYYLYPYPVFWIDSTSQKTSLLYYSDYDRWDMNNPVYADEVQPYHPKAKFQGSTLIVVGDSTSVEYTLPFTNDYNYNYSQQLYTPQEIGGQQIIDGLSFRQTNTDVVGRNITLYLGETDKTTFTDDNDWVTLDELTQVFEDSITCSEG